MQYTPENITQLNDNEIFVFGSNLAGRHGKGAAKLAVEKFGAEYGIGEGPSGKTYAIPTKGADLSPLPLEAINRSVLRLFNFVRHNKNLTFYVTKVGCGLAGYAVSDIAPMFVKFTSFQNVYLPREFWNEYGKF